MWLVYLIVATSPAGARRLYIGTTLLRASETTDRARRRRAREHAAHESRGALWLAGCDFDEDDCSVLAVLPVRHEALALELYWTLEHARDERDETRGGPYCSPLPTTQETPAPSRDEAQNTTGQRQQRSGPGPHPWARTTDCATKAALFKNKLPSF